MSQRGTAPPGFQGPAWADPGLHALIVTLVLWGITGTAYSWFLIPRLGLGAGLGMGFLFSLFATLLLGSILGQLGLFSRKGERAKLAGVGTALVIFLISHSVLAVIVLGEEYGWRWESDQDKAARLHAAAKDGDLEWVRKLLDAGVSPDARDVFGKTPLQTSRHPGAAALLLSRGANADVTDEEGQTPLMQAAMSGDLPFAAALVDGKAPLETKRRDYGDTALDLAVWTEHEDVAELLRKAGARDVTVTAANGTPLPPDGGAPMATVAAYVDAIEKQDVAAFRKACGPRPERYFESLDLKSWLSHPVVPRLVSGFANESGATLTLAGKRKDGHEVTMKLQLARDGTGAWKVLREWFPEPADSPR